MSMGIYLPNMDMPRKGQMLVIFPDGTSYVCFNGMRERLAQTTAIPVPEHGRLIDADALMKKAMPLSFSVQKWVQEVDIACAHTIIPADKEEKT